MTWFVKTRVTLVWLETLFYLLVWICVPVKCDFCCQCPVEALQTIWLHTIIVIVILSEFPAEALVFVFMTGISGSRVQLLSLSCPGTREVRLACRVPVRSFSETTVYYASKDGMKDGDGGKVKWQICGVTCHTLLILWQQGSEKEVITLPV